MQASNPRSGGTMQMQNSVLRGCSHLIRPRTARPTCLRRQLRLRAEEKPSSQKIEERKTIQKKEKLVKGFKAGGVDQETAKKILARWEETGATSPDGLRRMLLGRSLGTAGVVALQLLLDAGASYGSFNTARYLSLNQDFFGKIVFEYGAYFLASYFAVGVVFDLFTIGVLTATAVQYSTNTAAFMDAVKEVAGAGGGVKLGVIEKAQTAVNTLKVASALNNISGMLKEQAQQAVGSGSTLVNLSAYLTLDRAREKFGFDPANYNLSDNEAGQIATIFSRFDLNDDMRLEESELQRLTTQTGINLDDSEIRAAVKLLDKRGSGYIEFDEFVSWWTSKVVPEHKEIKV